MILQYKKILPRMVTTIFNVGTIVYTIVRLHLQYPRSPRCYSAVPFQWLEQILSREMYLFTLTCPNNGQLIFTNFENWYRNAVVTKQASEHYYLSHATFPFLRNRFLRPADFWLSCNYCVATCYTISQTYDVNII
jgi:hypothetical protein